MRDQTELSALGASLLEGAERIYSDMQDWRRDFHQFPELAFEENITGALRNGIAVGVYFFSQALSVEEAEEDRYQAEE